MERICLVKLCCLFACGIFLLTPEREAGIKKLQAEVVNMQDISLTIDLRSDFMI